MLTPSPASMRLAAVLVLVLTTTVRAASPDIANAANVTERHHAADSTLGDPAAPPLSARLERLKAKLRRCLARHFGQQLNTRDHDCWTTMHEIIPFGVDTSIEIGGPGGRQVTAIGWLCYNNGCAGLRLFYLDDYGRLTLPLGPGIQGHDGQFLAILAQSRVKENYPIRVGGKEFTIEDLIEYEKRTCRSSTELTFKLIGLSYYLDSDATWKNDLGETWSIARLIEEELAQPVLGAACGGTHRMMGFTYAVRRRAKEGKSMTGQWLRASKYVAAYIEYAFKLRNADGGFSTRFFEGRGDYGDFERRLYSTGHVMEWFLYALPDGQLRDPRVIESVEYLVGLLSREGAEYAGAGARGHALRALVIYNERVFGARPGSFSHGVPRVTG